MLPQDTTALAKLAARFWAKVAIPADDPAACWLWTAGTDHDGYGCFSVRGKTHRASRVAWELTHGSISDGRCVLHDCPNGDNPSCVNPAHLWLGTVTDNHRDMTQKGRGPCGDRNGARSHPERWARGNQHHSRLHPERLARGNRHGSHLHPERWAHGVAHGRAKVTDDNVREMRHRYAAGGITLQQLATEFGLSAVAVSKIIRRETWTHVN